MSESTGGRYILMQTEGFWVLRPFNPVFLCSFGFFIVLLVISSLILRNKSEKTRRIVLCTACVITVIGFFVYKFMLSLDADYRIINAAMGGFNWWTELPLNLCNINMILIPIAVWKRNRSLMSFCFFVGPLGALMALVMPSTGFSGYSLLLPRMMGFFFTHYMVFIESIALASFGLFRPTFKDIPKTLISMIAISLFAFLVNVILRKTGLGLKANYFFSVETEGNPLLELFNSWIPVPYLYLMPALVILAAYTSIVTLFFKVFGKKKAN